MKWLIVDSHISFETAREKSELHNCAGWINGVPPAMQFLASEQGWSIPCVIVQDEQEGEILSWYEVD
jgi:hypothetical protein